ncbi:Membrane-associating domain [Popillia japonica]|uniref:Membrane-associating domain n=1 Tax=Popillia japonica TaxID=7064 RepID=A0AAW1KI12_POPJA
MIQSRGPAVINFANSGGGLDCCCFKCCSCLNLYYLRTQAGILKIIEMVLGSFCQSLAINFGYQYSGSIGPAYYSFLTTASWSLMTIIVLLFCYIFSGKSQYLIRQSLFETVFNGIAAFCYISSCSYLGMIVNSVLYPMYTVTPFFQVYPAMTGTYVLGTIVGIIHGFDCYKSYRLFKGYR